MSFQAIVKIKNIEDPIRWWISIAAETKEEALQILNESCQEDFIVKEVDDLYENELSKLLESQLKIKLKSLFKEDKADLISIYDGEYLPDHIKNKGVYKAGLRLFRQYPLKSID